MGHRFSTGQLRGFGRLAWVAAVLGLLALPVEYRGGAERPHAHAAVQLWFDAAHGAIGHHARAVGATASDAAPPSPEMVHASGLDADESDTPRLSALTLSAGRILFLAAGIVIPLPVLLHRRRPGWLLPEILTGSLPNPETPPPRPLAAFA